MSVPHLFDRESTRARPQPPTVSSWRTRPPGGRGSPSETEIRRQEPSKESSKLELGPGMPDAVADELGDQKADGVVEVRQSPFGQGGLADTASLSGTRCHGWK